MRNAIVHILVVDDYEPFRRFLHLKLQSRPELQIVSEASDGFQAVQKAVLVGRIDVVVIPQA